MKHSPEPWWCQPTAGDHDFEIYNNQRTIALVRGTNEEAKANAILMHNAARMFKCLQAIRARVKGDFDHPALIEWDSLNPDSEDDISRYVNRLLNEIEHED
jgi:hypothetical protein